MIKSGAEHPHNQILTLKDPFISESCIEIKIKLNFYFHTSLWCLKRFYEGLKGQCNMRCCHPHSLLCYQKCHRGIKTTEIKIN